MREAREAMLCHKMLVAARDGKEDRARGFRHCPDGCASCSSMSANISLAWGQTHAFASKIIQNKRRHGSHLQNHTHIFVFPLLHGTVMFHDAKK